MTKRTGLSGSFANLSHHKNRRFHYFQAIDYSCYGPRLCRAHGEFVQMAKTRASLLDEILVPHRRRAERTKRTRRSTMYARRLHAARNSETPRCLGPIPRHDIGGRTLNSVFFDGRATDRLGTVGVGRLALRANLAYVDSLFRQ